MSLDEYKRKRRFEETPEPPPKVERKSRHRFVVQRHAATRLHYDFRLEMEGVLKSWAVPKGPSLDPADKRLAMQVEDHPVSYFDFEGTIPEGNYGGGTVMVFEVGTWQPLSPIPVNGEYVPGTEKEAAAMLAKGDLKFRLKGKRLNGDFALIKMKGRRPGSKGNEWLLIKKKDASIVPGFDIDRYDTSVLTDRTMDAIAGDAGSKEWTSSRPATRGKLKAAWLADAVARADKKGKAATAQNAQVAEKKGERKAAMPAEVAIAKLRARSKKEAKDFPADSVPSAVRDLDGAIAKPMPARIHPMLATSIAEPFDNPDWLFEIKWDGYRAVAFIAGGQMRLVSRNQNNLTAQFPELARLVDSVTAESAVIDGEIVALDAEGRPSFSLLQQRTGFQPPGKKRGPRRNGVPIMYFAFDLIYLDGYDLHKVPLEKRKQRLHQILKNDDVARFSDHYSEKGQDLFAAARQRGLEGILAKKRDSHYCEERTRDWLKIKITRTQECVVGGYTDPEGSRPYLGSLVVGLYDSKGNLIHVGQAGSGFNHANLKELHGRLTSLATKTNPFHGDVVALRKVHFVRPELVAEIRFTEWTHETAEGGMKMRAPVFLGLRFDKDPKQCRMEEEA